MKRKRGDISLLSFFCCSFFDDAEEESGKKCGRWVPGKRYPHNEGNDISS